MVPRAVFSVMTFNVGNGLADPRGWPGLSRQPQDVVGLEELAPAPGRGPEQCGRSVPVPRSWSPRLQWQRPPESSLSDRPRRASRALSRSRPDIHAVVDLDGTALYFLVGHPPPARLRGLRMVIDPKALAQMQTLPTWRCSTRPRYWSEISISPRRRRPTSASPMPAWWMRSPSPATAAAGPCPAASARRRASSTACTACRSRRSLASTTSGARQKSASKPRGSAPTPARTIYPSWPGYFELENAGEDALARSLFGAVRELIAEAGPRIDHHRIHIEPADRAAQRADQLIERRHFHARNKTGPPHRRRALLARADLAALAIQMAQQAETDLESA